MKLGGGDNGHNGLKDITKHFAGPNYYRVRIGVGRPPAPQDPADFVLKPFSSSEKKELDDFIARGALAVERLIEKGLEAAQQEFNK
jgi:PTH1 family peptidyl-tRNA hydrolase